MFAAEIFAVLSLAYDSNELFRIVVTGFVIAIMLFFVGSMAESVLDVVKSELAGQAKDAHAAEPPAGGEVGARLTGTVPDQSPDDP